MAQITIYLPDNVEKQVRRAAKADGESVSRWITKQVVHQIKDAWPKSVLDAAGAFPGFPGLEEIRKGYGADSRRERIE